VDWPLVSRYEQKLIAQHRRELEQRAGPGAVQEEKQRTAQAIRESDQFYNTAPYLQFVPYVTASLGRRVMSRDFYITRNVEILALFLLGLYTGRRGILAQPVMSEN
jgi:hypothetical protein